MYSIVLMAAVGAGPSTPAADATPAPVVVAVAGCTGCTGCTGVYAGCTGVSAGCCGGYSYASCHGSCTGGGLFHGRGLFHHKTSCHGCSGSYSCYGSCTGSYGACWGSCYGYAYPYAGCCGGCWGSCYGSYSYPAYPAYSAYPGYFGAAAPARDTAVAVAEKTGASLKFQLPASAALFVDGRPAPGVGTERAFYTPALAAGQKYFYDVKAVVTVDGQTVTEEKRVVVEAGTDLTESFGKLFAAVANKTELAGK